jgi:hypothetical protein
MRTNVNTGIAVKRPASVDDGATRDPGVAVWPIMSRWLAPFSETTLTHPVRIGSFFDNCQQRANDLVVSGKLPKAPSVASRVPLPDPV